VSGYISPLNLQQFQFEYGLTGSKTLQLHWQKKILGDRVKKIKGRDRGVG
jgi:hypothetical protein